MSERAVPPYRMNERDVHIVKPLVESQLKKVKKLAAQERNVFGSGYAFDELESYLELMLKDMEEFIEHPLVKEETEERMERIKNPKS